MSASLLTISTRVYGLAYNAVIPAHELDEQDNEYILNIAAELDAWTPKSVSVPAPEFGTLVSELALKEMDGVLLTVEVREQSRALGHDVALIDEAITLAAWAHRTDLRLKRASMPRTPYIEHPLRCAARALRWGVTDPDIILALLLHDTVEDHGLVLAEHFLPGQAIDEEHARSIVYDAYTKLFGPDVTFIVAALSNPLVVPEGMTDHEAYRAHVAEAIEDPRVAIAKDLDFTDNALSLHHTDDGGPRTPRLASKYLPLIPVFVERLERDDITAIIPVESITSAIASLTAGQRRLRQISARAEAA